MTGNIVSRRYARALFAIGQAGSAAELSSYGQDLAQIKDLIDESPELYRVFRNPVFSVEEKKAILQDLFAKLKLKPMVMNFCLLLADKGRLELLPEIQVYFSSLLDTFQGILRGELTTAVKLTDALKKNVQDGLKKQIKQEVILDFSVEKDILGGFKLKVGDKVMDASIKAQLDILKENIKRGE